jgi:hypothetical protein
VPLCDVVWRASLAGCNGDAADTLRTRVPCARSFKEVCATLRVLDATFCLPIGDGQPVVGRAGKGSLEMTNLTRSRKLIICLLCAGRLILAGLLLYFGGSFLAHTLEIDELILNGT